MPLVSDCQAIHESPLIIIENQFLQVVQMGGDSNDNQRQGDHSLWTEPMLDNTIKKDRIA